VPLNQLWVNEKQKLQGNNKPSHNKSETLDPQTVTLHIQSKKTKQNILFIDMRYG